MGRNTWWLTVAICFTVFAALQANGSPEQPMEQSNETVSTLGTTLATGMTVHDADDMESDDEEDDKEHVDREMAPSDLDFMANNPRVINGQPVFEGDIALTESQWRKIRERKAVRNIALYWRRNSYGYPYVPYLFQHSSVNQAVVRAGFNHWMEHTCIRFQETTNTNQPHLRFISDQGCWANLGMLNQNGQYVSIPPQCATQRVVVHEIGHAIGFRHEQSRPDRDSFVRIIWQNIRPDRYNEFKRYDWYSTNPFGIGYDYTSVMHYSAKAFSMNGGYTIVTYQQWAQNIIGTGSQLSHWDKLLANRMYGCIAIWVKQCGRTSDPCLRGGYLGKYCHCVCPPGTWGYTCER